MMTHEQDLRDEDVEELVEEIWTLGEEGRSRLSDLKETSRVAALSPALDQLLHRGLARLEGEQILLTDEGRTLAERQVRRHRLAEVLFTTVFQVPDEAAVNRTACVMEHVIGPGMTNSICAFLGHPSSCPHGKPIPPGSCCRSFSKPIEPLVQPLDRLPVGDSGKIVYVVGKDADRLVRLSGLGVVPGATVHLQQRSPAAIIRLGETTMALDADIAKEIYVKKTG
jgi:DtxR family Mn-dependent transcriptional regulator